MTERTKEIDAAASSLLDDELIQLITERDERALVALMNRYGGQVLAVGKRICEDELEANGVASDVFWDFWQHTESYQQCRGSLLAYLLTMARSRAIDRRRSAATFQRKRLAFAEFKQNDETAASPHISPEQATLQNEHAVEIQQAIGQLTDLQQRALQLAFFDGMSHSEVAHVLQVPLGTVKTHIRRGLLRLRCLLSESDSKSGSESELGSDSRSVEVGNNQ
ncbi:MAG: sigma-70 family RNA polymerase sigma factor [Pirellulaceae bacterium]|nr:sigma-70 family RNA polymerase sigma factor [Pirellulaceae bacterium]